MTTDATWPSVSPEGWNASNLFLLALLRWSGNWAKMHCLYVGALCPCLQHQMQGLLDCAEGDKMGCFGVAMPLLQIITHFWIHSLERPNVGWRGGILGCLTHRGC